MRSQSRQHSAYYTRQERVAALGTMQGFHSSFDLAYLFGVSQRTIWRYIQEARKQGARISSFNGHGGGFVFDDKRPVQRAARAGADKTQSSTAGTQHC